jgi:hypothetical protein
MIRRWAVTLAVFTAANVAFVLIGIRMRLPTSPLWHSLAWFVTFIACLLLYARSVFRLRRRLAQTDGLLCPGCGYDLRGVPEPGQCPECGRAFTVDGVRFAWRRLHRYHY